MEQIVQNFINNEDIFIPSLVATSIVVLVMVKSLTKMVSNIANERTRREIAAYIAEGSMTPEQGERLLSSGKSRGCN